MKKQLIYFFTTFLILLFVNLAFPQKLITEGDDSPAVWANSVSLAFGFSYKHIEKLDSFFKEEGIKGDDRRKKW